MLNSAVNALASTGSPTAVDYVVSNIKLDLIRLTDAAMGQIHGMSNGVFSGAPLRGVMQH